MFMTEFTDFLDQVTTRSESLVLLGDFNIQIDKSEDCYTKKFLQCLKSYGLVQHVDAPTHSSGHILDLVITKYEDRQMNIAKPVPDYYISDHCLVSCNIEHFRPPLTKKEVASRNWKTVSSDNLRADLEKLKNVIANISNVNDLVSEFTRITSDIADKHTLLTERTVLCRPTVPWYSGHMKQLKSYLRRSIEKIFMNNKSDLTKKIYNGVRNMYSA